MDKINSKMQLIIFVLIIILIWRILRNNLVLVIAILYLLWIDGNQISYNIEPENEGFDYSTREFVRRGEDRHDLRGALINTRPIEYWIPRYRYSHECH